jgi:lipoprotein-releasing system ATP-binding protein
MIQPIHLRSVSYKLPDRTLLASVDLAVGRGESVAVIGPSGSGKTTLLQIIAGILAPDGGEVVVDGLDMAASSGDRRARHRLGHIGLVFQFGELMPELTVEENVALPLRLLGRPKAAAHEAARETLEWVDAVHLAAASPLTLSSGETQRVAVARALVTDPPVVLADEPTGSLDEDSAEIVGSLMFHAVRARGMSLVVVTHNPAIATRADRIFRLRGGSLCPQVANALV